MKLSAFTARFLGNRQSAAVFRGMATLLVGSGIARVLGVAAIPILTRLYAPADFGAMAVFNALIGLLAPLLTLRYIHAIPLPRHDGLAINLMALSTGLMMFTGVVIAIGFALFAEPMLKLMSTEVLAAWWWLILLGLLGSGTYEMLSLWATRRRAYKVIAHTNVTQSAAGAVVKIVFGLFGAGPVGLLIGQVVAQSAGIGVILNQFWTEFRKNFHYIRLSRLKLVMIGHRGFPIYRLPSQFLVTLSIQAPVFFLATFFDANTTGQFGLAMAALALPLSLLGRTTANAFYAEAAKIGRRKRDEIWMLIIAVIKRLSAFAILPTLILVLFGTELFSFVFGKSWALAGEFASILAIYLFVQFVQTPIGHVFSLFQRHGIVLILNAQRLLLVCVSFGFAWFWGLSATTSIIVYASLLFWHYLLAIFVALQIIRRYTD